MEVLRCRLTADSHPAGGQGLWGSEAEVPSFLYAMPMQGGKRVFLEETCLVAKPALPFAVLKRRLERRLRASGIKVRNRASRPGVNRVWMTRTDAGYGALT